MTLVVFFGCSLLAFSQTEAEVSPQVQGSEQEINCYPQPDARGLLRAYIDNLYVQIHNLPGYQGIFILDFDPKENRKEKRAQLRQIVDALKFRKYDPNRLIVAIQKKASTSKYASHLVAPGGTIPVSADKYTLVRGEELIKYIPKLK